jgi:hypothetical protein
MSKQTNHTPSREYGADCCNCPPCQECGIPTHRICYHKQRRAPAQVKRAEVVAECWTCAHCPGHQVPSYKSAAATDTLTHGNLSRCYAPKPRTFVAQAVGLVEMCKNAGHNVRPVGKREGKA